MVGLVSTHVDDPLLVADDDAQELVGKVLDIRSDSLKHRSPPFTHCGPSVLEDRGNFQIDQSNYVLGMDPIYCNKNLPGNYPVNENTLDLARNRVGQLADATYGPRPDAAARVGELASCVNRFTNSNFAMLNTSIMDLRKSGNETKVISRKDLNRN